MEQAVPPSCLTLTLTLTSTRRERERERETRGQGETERVIENDWEGGFGGQGERK